jgi:RNA polymerase sigma factor (TIGR02999 family)
VPLCAWDIASVVASKIQVCLGIVRCYVRPAPLVKFPVEKVKIAFRASLNRSMESDDGASHAVTALLREWSEGDRDALDRLVPLVYDELRRVAQAQLRQERHAKTMQPTALVHELYLRLVGSQQLTLADRAHFLAVAARNMRKILLDLARRRNADKRRGGDEKVSLDEALAAGLERPALLISMDDALNVLAKRDPLLAQLIELRYFGGLTAEESSVVVHKETREVQEDIALAKAWLRRYMAA